MQRPAGALSSGENLRATRACVLLDEPTNNRAHAEQAVEVPAPVLRHFVADVETADLQAARQALAAAVA